MEIIELKIKNFGKFNDKTISLQNGINVIYGENEAGKSTLYSFLKGMLFGMERSRGRAAKNDAYSVYEPWDNPSWYAGSLRIRSGGKTFRLERSFGRNDKTESLVCEDDGEELSIDHGDLTMLLDGVTESGFENTMAVGQLRAEPDKSLADALKNYAAGYYSSGGGDIDVAGALSHIRSSIKENNGYIRDVEEQQQKRLEKEEYKLDSMRQEAVREADKLSECRRLLAEKTAVYENSSEEASEGRGSRFLMTAIGFASIIAAIFCIVFHMPYKYIIGGILGGIGIILLIFVAWGRRGAEYSGRKADRDKETPKEVIAQLKGRIRQIESDTKDIETEMANLEEQLEEEAGPVEEYVRLRLRADALELAADKITELSGDLHKRFGKYLNEKASSILSDITGEKYKKLLVSGDGSLNLSTPDRRISVNEVSRGTCEQIWFALRMASLDVLYGGELPVILDDTFAFYDDNRLSSSLEWLSENKKQVILFTCQDREMRILEQKGITCSVIRL